MNTWTPLWSGSPESSLWDESDLVFKVFLTMMATKDADHICRKNAYALAKLSRKTEGEVLEALRVLSSPDSKRLEHQDFEGRRIRAVEDGFLILNGEKYRAKVSDELRKARNRRNQQAYRDRLKRLGGSGKPLPGEVAALKAEARGDFAGAAAIAAAGLPESRAVRVPDDNGAIPQIPLRDQGVPEQAEEPQTESGSVVDGEWVPD